MRVGLAGFGAAGQFMHFPLLRCAGVTITAIVSSRDAAAVACAAIGASLLATYEELVARTDVDVVVVATPSHLHYAHAKAALLHHKHVVVDKPFTDTPEEAEELIALAAAQGVVLTVFQNRRWDCDFLTLQRLLRDGSMGDPVLLQMRWDRYRPAVSSYWKEQPGAASGAFSSLGMVNYYIATPCEVRNPPTTCCR